MNKNDKDKIMILVFLIAFILISVCMIKGTKLIPFRYLLLAILLIQYLYVVPVICKNYYQLRVLLLDGIDLSHFGMKLLFLVPN